MISLRNIGLVIFAIVVLSCSPPDQMSPQELNLYISNPDNGCYQELESNGLKIGVQYRPTDLWVFQELDRLDVGVDTINQLRAKYDNYYYFIVSLSKDSKEALHQTGDFGLYSELLQNMSFRMNQYVNLTTSKQDTIPVGDAMLNRTFGMSASTDILFVFNKEKTKGSDWVQFNLNEFGLSIGNQRFRFNTQDLNTAPRIYKIKE